MAGRRRSDVCTALVVSGGGARGAYQTGVLRGLVEQGFLGGLSPIDVFVGSSAGALNAAMLAAYADDFEKGLATLEKIWSRIEPEQVFRTDLRSLGGIGIKWAWDLSLGGATRKVRPKYLLDTAPLRRLLTRRIPFRRIDKHVEGGALRALAVSATDLYTANGVLFVHGEPELALWRRRRWSIEAAKITVDHLMASSAIPIFFPSVQIDGRHFGDGCIRNTTPLSPAINLGADRIIAIGVRGTKPPAKRKARAAGVPTIAQIAGILLDAVMLDAIEVDVEHSERVNRSIAACRTFDPENPFRNVDVLWLNPARSLGQIAYELEDRIPRIVRYLLRGLGNDEATTDLASYLLFDSVYCGRLIELGREDVAAGRDTIAEFFAASGESRRRA
jgi:NTE family protein